MSGRGDEFHDLAEAAEPRNLIDRRRLTDPVVIRAVVALAIGLAVILWPNRGDIVLARLGHGVKAR